MRIRIADNNDKNFVINTTHNTIKEIYPRYYPMGAVNFFIKYHNNENICKDIEDGYVYILEIENIPVATVTVNENKIGRLFVLPKYQKKGYGTVLMDYAEDFIGKNYNTIKLEASFPGKSMYIKRGYKHIKYLQEVAENGDLLCYDYMEKSVPNKETYFKYDGKTFIAKSNSENGEVDSLTTFNYHQKDNIIWAEYFGGDIIKGNILGTVSLNGELDFHYQHINKDGQQRIGKCHSIPLVTEEGKLELHEKWQWLNGDKSKGVSIIIEN